jgi:hypothetical protein
MRHKALTLRAIAASSKASFDTEDSVNNSLMRLISLEADKATVELYKIPVRLLILSHTLRHRLKKHLKIP